MAVPDNFPISRSMTSMSRDEGRIYLTGVQALVRLPLMQRRRDRAAGLNTAGFISGYRGSPLGTFDRELWAAKHHLDRDDMVFQPGLNEDLAATSVWGSQQLGLSPGAKRDGVFSIWYAKSPGVDRSGDVLKHANAAGTARVRRRAGDCRRRPCLQVGEPAVAIGLCVSRCLDPGAAAGQCRRGASLRHHRLGDVARVGRVGRDEGAGRHDGFGSDGRSRRDHAYASSRRPISRPTSPSAGRTARSSRSGGCSM